MINDIHKRTKFLVEMLSKNPNNFSVKTKILPQMVHFVIGSGKRKSKPSFDFICKIIAAFPQVNLRWYILGEGIWNAGNNASSQKLIQQFSEQLIEIKVLYAEERLMNEALRKKLREYVNKK